MPSLTSLLPLHSLQGACDDADGDDSFNGFASASFTMGLSASGSPEFYGQGAAAAAATAPTVFPTMTPFPFGEAERAAAVVTSFQRVSHHHSYLHTRAAFISRDEINATQAFRPSPDEHSKIWVSFGHLYMNKSNHEHFLPKLVFVVSGVSVYEYNILSNYQANIKIREEDFLKLQEMLFSCLFDFNGVWKVKKEDIENVRSYCKRDAKHLRELHLPQSLIKFYLPRNHRY